MYSNIRSNIFNQRTSTADAFQMFFFKNSSSFDLFACKSSNNFWFTGARIEGWTQGHMKNSYQHQHYFSWCLIRTRILNVSFMLMLNFSWSTTLKLFTMFVVNLFLQHRVPIFLCFKDQKLAHLKSKYYIRGPPAKSLVKSRRSTQKSDSLWKRRRIVPGTPENYYWGLSIWIEYYRIWEGLIIIVGWLLVQDLKNIQDSHIQYSYSLSILIFIPQLKGYLKTTFPCNTLECVLSAALKVDEYIKSSFLPHFLFSCQLSGQKRLVNSLIVVIDVMNCC